MSWTCSWGWQFHFRCGLHNMVPSKWSPIHNTKGGCPYVPSYCFSLFNNTALILKTNYLHKQNTTLILIRNYYFSFFNNTALINVFFLFPWQQNEINNMLNLAVANQQRNDLTAQQVLPLIVKGLTRLKLSMEENISSVPTQRVRHFRQRQRHQGRQPQTSTQRG